MAPLDNPVIATAEQCLNCLQKMPRRINRHPSYERKRDAAIESIEQLLREAKNDLALEKGKKDLAKIAQLIAGSTVELASQDLQKCHKTTISKFCPEAASELFEAERLLGTESYFLAWRRAHAVILLIRTAKSRARQTRSTAPLLPVTTFIQDGTYQPISEESPEDTPESWRREPWPNSKDERRKPTAIGRNRRGKKPKKNRRRPG